METQSYGTVSRDVNCKECHKPFTYVGDVPSGGWQIGLEPFCTCNTPVNLALKEKDKQIEALSLSVKSF